MISYLTKPGLSVDIHRPVAQNLGVYADYLRIYIYADSEWQGLARRAIGCILV